MEINGQITVDEILKSIKELKTEKVCGDDNIINDYIIHVHICLYRFMLNCLIVYSIQVKYRVHSFQEILYPYSRTRGNLMILKIVVSHENNFWLQGKPNSSIC